MLQATISCRCGLQKWARVFSISAMLARPRRPSRSPRRVTSSRPPAPPPTTTTSCGDPGLLRVAGDSTLAAESSMAERCLPKEVYVSGLRIDFREELNRMYSRILVATDGSETSDLAIEQAARLAKDQHAQLRIVHVVEQ